MGEFPAGLPHPLISERTARNMDKLTLLTMKMIDYESGCPARINHFLKVTAYARTIAEMEGLDENRLYTLTAAALTHDIGIKPSLEKYGNCNGEHQQVEGPPVAEKMLTALGFERNVIDRVCWLIAHHHTYTDIIGADYRILVEADFLVNLDEGNSSADAKSQAREKMFQTRAGLAIFDRLFPEIAHCK